MARKNQINVDSEVMKRVAKFQGDVEMHRKGASAENECRNMAVMNIYGQLVAETMRLPGKADHYPTKDTGKALVEALQAHGGMSEGSANRYWKTTRGAVHRFRKESLLPAQATAEAVMSFFNENSITSQNQLGKWAGTIEVQSDKVEKMVDLLFGKKNAKTGKRNSQQTLDEIMQEYERFKVRAEHTAQEVRVQDEALAKAEAENRKIEEVLKEMTGE